MKLVPYDLEKIGYYGAYRKTRNLKILDEFVKSGHRCVKIEDYPQKDAKNCSRSLKASIRKFKLNGIKVSVRGQDVFLINTGIDNPRLSYED